MSRFIGLGQDCPLFDGAMNAQRKLSAIAWSCCAAGLLALAAPQMSHADNGVGATSASARIDFRIVIPAIIRVTAITQPDRVVIESRHITQGYIDLDAGTTGSG